MFGDFKEPKAHDVPINPQSGKHVAGLIATGNRPAVNGFRGWSTAKMQQFWIDFAEMLFAKNAGELYVVGDEFHNFAPKGKVLSPQAGESLHWSNRLLSEGRGLGLVCLIASQRPQKVHNDTLTSCETLVAMRVIHAADRGAVKDWIDGAGDAEMGKQVLGALAGLPRGEAYVWSPEVNFRPKRIAFPMFTAFDWFAPPQLQRKVSNAGWADVDLDVVKEKLASVIEQAKANDPVPLRRELAEAKAELTKLRNAPAPVGKVETKTVEKPIITDKQIERLEKLLTRSNERLATVGDKARDLVPSLHGALKLERDEIHSILTVARNIRSSDVRTATIQPVAAGVGRVAPPAPARPRVETVSTSRPSPGTSGEGERRTIDAPMSKILDSYAWWHSIGVAKPSREMIAPIAGYSNIRSSGFAIPCTPAKPPAW
jgi:hypothetical protein